MFYLILAIATSTMISVVMLLSGDKVKHNMAMLAVSYMAGAILALCYVDISPAPGLPVTAAMAVINGLFYVAGLVLMQWSIPKNGVVLTSTYMKLGLIVCMALSVILFREIPTVVQLVGFCLAVTAIVLNGRTDQTGSSRSLPILLLLLLVSGLGDTWVKVFGTFFDSSLSDRFLVATFLAASVLCLGMTAWKKQKFGLWEIVFGVAVAVPNYYNSRFLLKSLQTLPGIIVYPTFSVGTLLLITVLGVCLFKERLTKRQWTAMALILAALVLLNM